MDDPDATHKMPADVSMPVPAPVEKSRGRIGVLIGDYEVEGELGRGGMGVVYRARQGKLNRQVALKMLTGHYGADELQRFLAEAQTAAALHHTNIVHIYEVGENEGAPFFSMEFVEGGTLADRLRKGLLTTRETAALLISVARALHFAHQHGVVHRDMKPGNILLDPEGVPKVADFGIAKRVGKDSRLTLSGAIVGTPTYMAPEQAGGTSRDAGPAADVYSLGAILYEMLTGRPPFLPEESETAITVRVITEETISPAWHRPEIPREMEVICMKCLQKDPRDRYASAAAFAEDLRRFLDDEPIIARPPSGLVRTIKWVRRHPWKAVGRLALLALIAAGGYRLFEWDSYERTHMEYAGAVDYVHGWLEPVVRLSREQAAKHSISLRLTRRGSRGPVTQVEVLNPRGYPATIRRVVEDEAIPIYFESLAGTQPYSERKPETEKVEFTYQGGKLVEVIGRDRDGAVTWRIIYEPRSVASGNPKAAWARYVDLNGFANALAAGAEYMEIERDAAGRDSKVSFFNSEGQPAFNGEHVYGYRLVRDSFGHITGLVNLGKDGKPGKNRAGWIACELTRNAAGSLTRFDFRDGEGKPAVWNDIAAATNEYDAAGNKTRITRLGGDGQFARGGAVDWARQEIARNERGEVTGRKYLKATATGGLEQVLQQTYAYDEFGHPADIRSEGAAEWHSAYRYDQKGDLIEERYLDESGRLVAGDYGYAIKRSAYTVGPQGIRREDTYFDALDAKTYGVRGYSRLIDEFDPAGILHRQTMEDHDPKRFDFYRSVSELEWDPRHNLYRRSTLRFEDAQGRLAANSGMEFSESDDEFDEKGRKVESWQFGWDVKRWGASVWHAEIEWHSTGVMRRRIWQACDSSRQALETVSTGNPARTEEEFDSIGTPARTLETGFDQTRMGFYSRVLQFISGNFESVVYRNKDGSPVKNIRVMVRAILESAQRQARELQVGDQLLTANGTPVGSMYDWAQSMSFPGGFIEILREGKTLRIDGFQAGPLGILLEDRGPVASADPPNGGK